MHYFHQVIIFFQDGLGTNARFGIPEKLVISRDQSYALISDGGSGRIRKILLSNNQVTTLAGSSQGYANGFGTNVQFNANQGLDISLDETYALIADQNNQQIRKLNLATFEVTTFLGDSARGTNDNNGVGTNAGFSYHVDVDISPDGTYALIGDSNNRQIRKVTLSTANVQKFAGRSAIGSKWFWYKCFISISLWC